MTAIPWLEPSLVFRADRPIRELVTAYVIQLHGHRELLSRGIGYALGHLSPEDADKMLATLECDAAVDPPAQRVINDIRKVLAGSPTPLLMKQSLASVVADRVRIDVDSLAVELFHHEKLANWKYVNEIASCGLLVLAWEATRSAITTDASHPLWQFFRHVRNAAAHNGRIELRPGQPDKPAHWRGITIHAQLHGCRLFAYPPDNGLLSPGDCLYLLSDVEAVMLA